MEPKKTDFGRKLPKGANQFARSVRHEMPHLLGEDPLVAGVLVLLRLIHDLDLGELKTSLGLGLRVHTSRETLLRLEVARSRDGLRLILGTGAVF